MECSYSTAESLNASGSVLGELLDGLLVLPLPPEQLQNDLLSAFVPERPIYDAPVLSEQKDDIPDPEDPKFGCYDKELYRKLPEPRDYGWFLE